MNFDSYLTPDARDLGEQTYQAILDGAVVTGERGDMIEDGWHACLIDRTVFVSLLAGDRGAQAFKTAKAAAAALADL